MRKVKRVQKSLLCAVVAAGLLAALSAGCSQKEEEPEKKEAVKKATDPKEIHILAAASMTDAFTEMEELFEKQYPEIALTFSFDSSGTLKTQIEEGAPADVFVSAAMKQMNELDEAGLMDSASIQQLLENKVVLIKPKESALEVASFEDVATDKVTMVAIGGADVPVGQYTETIYTNLGLWENISAKANLGTNVRQVLDWVATGNVDCGVVYETDAKIESNVEIICEAPEGSCNPVIYPAGIVKETKNPAEAGEFMSYLETTEAKDILTRYGFTVL